MAASGGGYSLIGMQASQESGWLERLDALDEPLRMSEDQNQLFSSLFAIMNEVTEAHRGDWLGSLTTLIMPKEPSELDIKALEVYRHILADSIPEEKRFSEDVLGLMEALLVGDDLTTDDHFKCMNEAVINGDLQALHFLFSKVRKFPYSLCCQLAYEALKVARRFEPDSVEKKHYIDIFVLLLYPPTTWSVVLESNEQSSDVFQAVASESAGCGDLEVLHILFSKISFVEPIKVDVFTRVDYLKAAVQKEQIEALDFLLSRVKDTDGCLGRTLLILAATSLQPQVLVELFNRFDNDRTSSFIKLLKSFSQQVEVDPSDEARVKRKRDTIAYFDRKLEELRCE